MILIISDIRDKHADQVESILQRNDAKYSRLNLDIESLKVTRISYELDSFKVEGPNCNFSSDEIDAVWNRSSRIENSIEDYCPLYEDFVNWKEKCNKTLEGLFASLKSTKWLNFNSDFYLDNHFRQYAISKNIGLKWPSYICSNDINYLNSFFENKRDRVLKLMDQQCKMKSAGNCSAKCNEKFGAFSSDEKLNTDCLVAGTAYRVRCTVVGKEYFVGKIKGIINREGKAVELAQPDCSVVQPPMMIKKKAIDIMTELNLTHGVFDFNVTDNDEWFFDALNPIGPYHWTEDIEGTDISSSIAKWLMTNN